MVSLAAGLIPSLLIGRLYCGFLCPFALIQEILFATLPSTSRRTSIAAPSVPLPVCWHAPAFLK
ncbi:MAG: 4Fe-4S binding protein [Candidatus Omnitrophica bacterium]|nr:4Fe-4S binding protein [Candidatus Omnitrophota bacterium]